MLQSDIIDTVGAVAIEQKIGGEWKHEVCILGESSRHLNFQVDGKEYVAVFTEVTDGHDWSEYV